MTPTPELLAKARMAERAAAPAQGDVSRTGRLDASPAPDGEVGAGPHGFVAAAAAGVGAAVLLAAAYYLLLTHG